jgi:hypothetical protein
MANEYELSSGFLGMRQLKQDKEYKDAYIANQKEETRLKGGYYESAANENAAKAGLYRQQTNKSILDQGLIRGRAEEMGFDLDSFLGDISSTGSYMGVEGTFKPRVKQKEPMSYGLTNPARQNSAQAGVDGYLGIQPQRIRGYVHGGLVQHFNDGSVGAVRDQEDFEIGQAMLAQQAEQEAMRTRGISPNPNMQIDPNATSGNGMARLSDGTINPTQANTQGINRMDEIKPPVDLEDSQESPFQTLARDNPNEAKNVFKKIQKETSNFKNLSKSLLALQKFDYIEGKVTTKGMLENVQALQKMQNEGFFSAVNEVIYGDNNKALEMYREFGDDKAQDVKSLTTFDIQEDVPNSKVKEKRKGVLVTYDDGTTRKIDPKKLIIDAISATKFIDYGQATQKDLREGEDKDLDRISQDAYRLEQAAGRRDSKEESLNKDARSLLNSEAQGEFNRKYKSFLASNGVEFISNPEEKAKVESGILETIRPIQELGAINIGLGNRNINFANLEAAQKIANNPNAIDDNNNFAKDKNGKFIIKPYAGKNYALSSTGVYIPLSK